MKLFAYLLSAFLFFTGACHALQAQTDQGSRTPQAAPAGQLLLKKAVMCQRVENLTPISPGAVFSVLFRPGVLLYIFRSRAAPHHCLSQVVPPRRAEHSDPVAFISEKVVHLQCNPAEGDRQGTMAGRSGGPERACFRCPSVQHN